MQYCVEHSIPIFPGCLQPLGCGKALSFGLTYLKFFPAEACGGLKTIKAMCGPYTNVTFMPTGGINEDNSPATWPMTKSSPAAATGWSKTA